MCWTGPRRAPPSLGASGSEEGLVTGRVSSSGRIGGGGLPPSGFGGASAYPHHVASSPRLASPSPPSPPPPPGGRQFSALLLIRHDGEWPPLPAVKQTPAMPITSVLSHVRPYVPPCVCASVLPAYVSLLNKGGLLWGRGAGRNTPFCHLRGEGLHSTTSSSPRSALQSGWLCVSCEFPNIPLLFPPFKPSSFLHFCPLG